MFATHVTEQFSFANEAVRLRGSAFVKSDRIMLIGHQRFSPLIPCTGTTNSL